MVHPIQGSRFCQEISVPAFAMSSAEMTAFAAMVSRKNQITISKSS